MKRSLITTLVIGVAVAIVVGILHATKAIAGFEAMRAACFRLCRSDESRGRKVAVRFCLTDSSGVAWLSLRNPPRWCASLFGSLLVDCLVFRGSALFIGSFSSRFRAFLQWISGGLRGRVDRFFAKKSLAFCAHTLCQSPLQKNFVVSATGDSVRWGGKGTKSVVVCDIANDSHSSNSSTPPVSLKQWRNLFARPPTI